MPGELRLCMSDRRVHTRFCPAQAQGVTFRDSVGAEHAATILNESLGGLALSCEADCVMIPGTTMTVVYQGMPLRAIVWHSRSDGDRAIVFGIEWLD
jgi:hypothetical protein